MRTQMTILQHNGLHCISAVVQLLARGSSLAELQPLAHTYLCQQIERIEKWPRLTQLKTFLQWNSSKEAVQNEGGGEQNYSHDPVRLHLFQVLVFDVYPLSMQKNTKRDCHSVELFSQVCQQMMPFRLRQAGWWSQCDGDKEGLVAIGYLVVTWIKE